MSSNFQFTRHSQPKEVALDSVGKHGFTTFFAIGIVNPMGPTMNVLAADGIGRPGDRLPLLHLMLNPFSQSCHEVATLELGEQWSPQTDLMPYFSLPFGSCPTLLIPSVTYNADTAHSLFAELLKRFENGGGTLAGLRQYPGDPWKRVKAEMDGATGVFAKVKKGLLGDTQPRRLTIEEAYEFARLQLQPKNLKAEFDAFGYAWKGAIDFAGLGHLAMSTDKFATLFGQVAMTARLPHLHNITDHPEFFQS